MLMLMLFTFGHAQEVEATDLLLEGVDDLARVFFFCDSEDDWVPDLFAVFVPQHSPVQYRRLACLGMRVVLTHSVHLDVSALSCDELFVDEILFLLEQVINLGWEIIKINLDNDDTHVPGPELGDVGKQLKVLWKLRMFDKISAII